MADLEAERRERLSVPQATIWDKVNALGVAGMLVFVLLTAIVGGIVSLKVDQAETHFQLSAYAERMQRMEEAIDRLSDRVGVNRPHLAHAPEHERD